MKLIASQFILPLIIAASCSFLVLLANAKSHHRNRSLPKCQQDECQLAPQHYSLYSFIKRSLESNFDLRGKEIYPLIRSVEQLKRRFATTSSERALNGSALVEKLLANESLKEALAVFATDEGSALVDLYRSPINGRNQNLACSQLRVEALERASRKLDSNQRLASVFIKIHENFLRQSVKKCLKHSCQAVDVAMSRLDSTLMSRHQAASITWEEIVNLAKNATQAQQVEPQAKWTREFNREELELCHLFQRSNQSDCQVSGSELAEIVLLKGRQEANENNKTSPSLSDYLLSFYENKLATAQRQQVRTQQDKIDEASRSALGACRTLRGLLDYNLAGLKWYGRQGALESHRLSARSFWCPSLSYWLQVDRLCGELETSLGATGSTQATNGTFSYEVTTNQHL